MKACDKSKPSELARNSFTPMQDPAGSGLPPRSVWWAPTAFEKKRNGDLMSGAARAAGRRHAGSPSVTAIRRGRDRSPVTDVLRTCNHTWNDRVLTRVQRHAVAPFRIVQSADYYAAGLFVRRHRERIHAVRCSSAADLYCKIDGTVSAAELCRGYLERLSMRRADLAYAPSRILAEHFRRVHGMKVDVIRPPIYLETQNLSPPPFPLPSRFFLHFGQLMERKGTALLAQALPIAWKAVPDLTMVWCGRCWDRSKLRDWQSSWGDRGHQVQITGPLAKPQMYDVLQRADATVLPSQVDNLPNTVIESLMFGIPVLGSRGASIDELVEEGRTGHLVALGDVDGLAATLARMWRGESSVSKGFEWNSEIAMQMQPQRAIANLVVHLAMSKRKRR
jgi:glycosyltransferase involved in cell wall biosynthesis